MLAPSNSSAAVQTGDPHEVWMCRPKQAGTETLALLLSVYWTRQPTDLTAQAGRQRGQLLLARQHGRRLAPERQRQSCPGACRGCPNSKSSESNTKRAISHGDAPTDMHLAARIADLAHCTQRGKVRMAAAAGAREISH